jgi:hypothetical protein
MRPGALFADIDLCELADVDPRWPRGRGRCLWFRLRPRGRLPRFDQTWGIRWLNGDLPSDDEYNKLGSRRVF